MAQTYGDPTRPADVWAPDGDGKMQLHFATRLFRLAFLSPDVIAAILGGRHPPELTVRKLLDDTRLPLA